MQHNLSISSIQPGRRSFLKASLGGTLAMSAGMLALANHASANAAAAPAEEVSKPGAPKPVPTEALFRMGVIGPAQLSLVTSQMAVEKATQKNAKEFAGFELTEAIAVTTVLKDLGTPVPPPDAKGQEILAKLKAAAKGAEFDRAYIAAQLENHEFLRDHAEDFIKHAEANKANPMEHHGMHLAVLALATFKEHVAICQRIKGELAGG